MNGPLKRLFGAVHLWLGLLSGLVVFVVSITGCLIVFESELTDVSNSQTRFVDVPPQSPRAPPSRVFAAARAVLPNQALKRLYYTEYSEPDRALSVWAHDDVTQSYRGVWVDPYSGRVLHAFEWAGGFGEDFFGTAQKLHTSLLLGEVGEWVIGVATLIFVVQLVTGLVLWWPRHWRTIRPRLTLKLSARKKRLNYDLHHVVGFYFAWVLVIVALTGLVWSFRWVESSIYWLAAGDAPTTELPHWKGRVHPTDARAALETLDELYPRLRAAHPRALRFTFEEPHATDEPLHIDVHYGVGEHAYRTHFFDPATGDGVHVRGFGDLNRGEQLRSLNWDLHTGTLAGLPTKALAFTASLVSASLPVTGFLIWYPRWRRQRSGRSLGSSAGARPGPREA